MILASWISEGVLLGCSLGRVLTLLLGRLEKAVVDRTTGLSSLVLFFQHSNRCLWKVCNRLVK